MSWRVAGAVMEGAVADGAVTGADCTEAVIVAGAVMFAGALAAAGGGRILTGVAAACFCGGGARLSSPLPVR